MAQINIDDLLAELGALTGDARDAAIDAISAIISARQKSAGGSGLTKDTTIEIDPDLAEPEKQNNVQNVNPDDVDIDDPEHLLKTSDNGDDDENDDDSDEEDKTESESNNNSKSSNSSGGKSKSSKQNDSDTETTDAESEDETDVEAGTDSDYSSSDNAEDSEDSAEYSEDDLDDEEAGNNKNSRSQANSDSSSTGQTEDPNYYGEDNIDLEKNKKKKGKSKSTEKTKEDDKSTAVSDENEKPDNTSEINDGEDNEESENDLLINPDDEDEYEEEEVDDWDTESDSIQNKDFVDPNAVIGENGTTQAEYERRRVTKARVERLGEKALKKAIEDNRSRGTKDILQRALDKVTALTDEDLINLSDDKFNEIINDVLDAVDSITKVSYSDDLPDRAAKFKQKMNDLETARDIEDEDDQYTAAEHATAKAREAELNKYKSFRGIAEFKLNLYRAIKNQVDMAEEEEDTYSALSRRNAGANILLPGQRLDDKENNAVPSVDVFFDQSGSWGEDDVVVGEQAIKSIMPFVDKKEVKLNIYYFSNHVYSDAASARAEGGTSAWREIIQNIQANGTKNVVIMTDSDMGYQAKRASHVVDGCVWYIWRNNENSQELVKSLRGRKGTYQYSFSS